MTTLRTPSLLPLFLNHDMGRGRRIHLVPKPNGYIRPRLGINRGDISSAPKGLSSAGKGALRFAL